VLVRGHALAPSVNDQGQTVENSITKVVVGGKPVDVLDADGDFFTVVHINNGQNVFSFTATDQYNQTATTGLTLVGQPAGTIDFGQLQENPDAKPAFGQTSFAEKSNTLWLDLAIRNNSTLAMHGPILANLREISDTSVHLVNADGAFPDGSPNFNFSGLVGDGTLAAGESTALRSIAIANPNRVRFDFGLGVSSRVNQPPMFSNIPIVIATAGATYQYDANATDPEHNPLTFSLDTAPAGMTVDPSTGVLNWSPTAAQAGRNRVSLKVIDGQGGSATESFTIQVANS